MRDSVTVIIPMLPPRECSPNFHGHWSKRAGAAAMARHAAYYATQEVAASWTATDWTDACRPTTPILMDVIIEWNGTRRAIDDDNAWASIKPMRDGIADVLYAGEDKMIRQGTLSQIRGDGTTTVTLRTPDLS